MKKKAMLFMLSAMLMASTCNAKAMDNKPATDPAKALTGELSTPADGSTCEEVPPISETPDSTDSSDAEIVNDSAENELPTVQTPPVYSEPESQPTETNPAVSSGWVLSGGNWYYYSNNQLHKGWLYDNGWYLLMPDTGIMATGECEVEGKTYRFNDSGLMYENQWYLEDGKWYYYGASGARTAGWLYNNGWYFLDTQTGVMKTGEYEVDGISYRSNSSGLMYENQWYLEDGKWYYYGASGARTTGWLYNNGWYFLDTQTGVMKTGEYEVDGISYRSNSSGLMYENQWYLEDGKWYYYGASGAKAAGWLYNNGWYYLTPDTGIMVTEPQKIDGLDYRFHSNGCMYSDEWYNDNNTWYYYGTDGSMKKNGWILVQGLWYYTDKDGAMQTGWLTVDGIKYYLNASGDMAYDSWKKFDNDWYYFESSGAMATGWKKIGVYWYYMYEDGTMAHDTTVDGYELTSSGAWIPGESEARAAAQGVIALAGNDLYNCYLWIISNCTYASVYGTPPDGYTWDQWRASEMFKNRQGDCHNFAALFGYTARELGYDAKIIQGYTTNVAGDWVDHGWVEINGAIYDPDMEYELGFNCFGTSPFPYKY